ncbi:MAG TPA: hypothetical protein VN810_10070 [Terriglobales bacterium]|nr:hypothetical protein [Terriglobales bacterium]
MPAKKHTAKPREVHVYVGTRKGGFRFRSDLKRKRWQIDGPFFSSWEVTQLSRDPHTGHLWSALHSAWWGRDLQVSRNGGKKWEKSAAGLEFPQERGWNLARIWRVVPSHDGKTRWCGVDPGALFRSEDGGKNWHEVTALSQHPTRERWNPGAAGMMVHTIIPDPDAPRTIYIGISAAGCFRSDDDGANWTPLNKGVRADFLPNKLPDVGQCLHSMVMTPSHTLFQQNHCGVYRSTDRGETWKDISRGLPSRFGFAIAANPQEDNTVYVIPSIDPEHRYTCDRRLGVYRSANGGKSWQLLTRGLPQKNVFTQVLRHGAASDTCDPAGVYFGTTSGELYGSANGGNSWELLQANLPGISCVYTAVV